MLLNKHTDDIVLVKLQSRFRSPLEHHVFVKFEPAVNGDTSGKILGHFCKCQQGARTLGACSNITAVLWYLGYARHENLPCSTRNYCDVLLDAAERTAAEEHIQLVADCDEVDEDGLASGQDRLAEFMTAVQHI